MIAEIISIGDELLIGQVVNTNASWIAQRLNETGILVGQITSISDHPDKIKNTLSYAAERSELVIITGGLGPTKDDLTKQALCEYFDTRLVYNDIVFQNITSLFRNRGLQWNKLNEQQAYVPENCKVLKNKNGTAPGMWFEKEGVIYISLPGVPYEMKPLIKEDVIPVLKKRFNLGAVVHKTVLTQGIPESVLATRIESWEDQLPADIKLAYLPRPGMVRLRLSTSGRERKELEKKIEIELNKLDKILPGEVFGGEEDSLEALLGSLLRETGSTISTAESCTGGYIAHLLTSVAGSSDYYRGSVIAYSNDIKEQELGVSPDDLSRFGAVSEAVVKQMASGAIAKFKTDYSIATSGIAGPSGGSAEKPVGTIWIAISSSNKTIAKQYQFGDHRERNIKRTAYTAINMIIKEIKSNLS